jgi:hypothetical protein
MRKELKEEKEKIALMDQEQVIRYMKNLMLQMSKVLNKENNLLRKKKYTEIKEDTAWLKVKLSNIMLYCSELILKFKDIKALKDELSIINIDFAKLMESLHENKLHIMRVAGLQQIALELSAQNANDTTASSLGYDESSRYLSVQNPLKYSKAVNTNQYT